MSRSILIDAILAKETALTDLAGAILEAFSHFPQDEGDADYIGSALCPKYGKYLPLSHQAAPAKPPVVSSAEHAPHTADAAEELFRKTLQALGLPFASGCFRFIRPD